MENLLSSILLVSDCRYLICDTEVMFAYLDPGSGAMIFQMLIASVAGAAVGIKLFWRNIAGIFAGRGTKDKPVEKQGMGK